MRKLLLLLSLVISSCLNVYSQATSVTVDCQIPGFLSSYISPNDISTIRNLTISGKINQTDLAVIGNLVKNYSLQGHLDLSDVDIVDNRLSGDMFGVNNCQLEFFGIPKSVTQMQGVCDWVQLDTLLAGSFQNPYFGYSPSGETYESINYGAFFSQSHLFDVKHLILREGTTSIVMTGKKAPYVTTDSPLQSIYIPETLKEIRIIIDFKNLVSMNVPQEIEYMGEIIGTGIRHESDTLFVPQSVKTFFDSWARDDGYYEPYLVEGGAQAGHIRYVYLPEHLENFWVTSGCLHGWKNNGAKVEIHIKSKIPPIIKNGSLGSKTVVYVPEGYKEVYETTQWGGATILEEVYAESIEINASDILYVGDIQTMTADFTPSNTTFKDIFWGVSDNTTLSISQDGMCSALRYGIAQVTAINADHSCTDTKTIKVYEHTAGIDISKNTLRLKIGEKSTLTANTLPLETSDGLITWSTDDDMVATVDENGNVRGVSRGTCTITATSVDGGYTATCEVTVTQPAEAVTLEKHSLTLKVGDTDQLFAQITPATADNKVIDWSSSDEEVVSVDASGNIVALKSGEAWVKAVSNDNAAAKDSCKVTVTQSVSGITLAQDSYTLLSLDETVQIEATVLPADATNKEIRWSSSNENVCVVNDGKVTPTGYGMAIVMASTIEGGYSASCIVKVLEMGDANGDCVIDKADAEEVAYYILGRPSSKFIFVLADVNEDKKISILDAVGIINIAIMKSTASARLKALDEQ